MRKYFRGSFIFTIICLILAFIVWRNTEYSLATWLSTLFIVAVLGVLEVSLSFDNAVVNVTVLREMDEKRRKRFMTRWILIAVVGMRIIFPVILVSLFGDISPWSALVLAFNDSVQYGEILASSHVAIAWFGGAFLLMVGFKFFFDKEKEIHRIARLEKWMTKLGKIEAIEASVVLIILEILSNFIPVSEAHEFFVSGVWWVVLYIIINGLGSFFDVKNNPVSSLAQKSFILFVYLELLDASFSLDGVIGAFALSTNIIVIALGLGIGAYFVRSITIYLYEKWTLNTYRYLEHGAFYAIVALAVMMIMGIFLHIPEFIIGLIGAIMIGLSVWSSLRHKGE